jgi:hypothetical protein
MSVTAKGKRWELLNSLWIVGAFTGGFFNWVPFLYIGVRARQPKWLLWGLVYAIPFIFFMFVVDARSMNGMLGDLTTGLQLITAVVSPIHAFRIRDEYLLRLVALERGAAERDETLKRRLGVEMSRGEAARTQRTAVSDEVDRSVPRPTSEKPEESAKPPPVPSTSPAPEPAWVALGEAPEETPSKRSEVNPVPSNYPLPLAYSYRLADAEFETFRTLKELYRNAEGLTAFLASLALALAPTPTGRTKKDLLWA